MFIDPKESYLGPSFDYITIDLRGVTLHGEEGDIQLTKETSPQLWAIHEAMKRIEAIDPNYLATLPIDKVVALYKSLVLF